MTVPIEQIRYVYAGPYDVSDQIPIPFVYSEEDTVKLLVDNKAQTLNIDYSVLGQTLTVLTPININSSVVVYRETPLDQDSKYPQEAEFDSAKLEGNLDKLTMQNQEQEDTLSRCIKMAPDTPENINVTFPSPDPGKTIIWNNDGTGLTNSAFTLDDAINRTEGAADRAENAADRAEEAADKAEALQDRAEEAKSWAIGDLQERPEGSAWYWANEAQQIVKPDSYTYHSIDQLITKCSPTIIAGQFLKYGELPKTGIKLEDSSNIYCKQITAVRGRYGVATDEDGIFIVPWTMSYQFPERMSFEGDTGTETTLVVGVSLGYGYSDRYSLLVECGLNVSPETVEYGYKFVGNMTVTYDNTVDGVRYYKPTSFTQTCYNATNMTLNVDAQLFTPTAWGALSDADKQKIALAFVYEED